MGKRKSKEQQKLAAKRQPVIADNIAESDDEEISEDEAFNSDDERMYGHFFSRKEGYDETDGSEDSDEDETGESDDGQYMLDLLDKMGTSSESHEQSTQKKKLTLDNLMDSINDTQGYNKLRKSLTKKVCAVSAPMDKRSASRQERNHAYMEQVRNLSGWTKVIQENRQAETLDFKSKTRVGATKESLVNDFEPKSEFENDLSEALERAGQEDEDAILRREEVALQDDLGSNQLSMDEYKKRRNQLAQIRALMFYHEQKRHHMKKIKSKKYRRIRKKQKQRLQDSMLEAAMQEDEGLADEMKEKEEVSRIQERMTLAHKNTSKWAKRILKRGKNVDLDTRKALSAQLKRGDDLRRKMNDVDNQSANDGESDGEDILKSAEDILGDLQSNDQAQVESHGIFKLSFMQRGIQKQRNLAKEEARKLLTELRSNEIEEPSNMTPVANTAPSQGQVATPKERKKHLIEGKMIAKSREFGVSNSTSSSGPINVLTGDELGSGGFTSASPERRKKDDCAIQTTESESKSGDKRENHVENPWVGNIDQTVSSKASVSTKNDLKIGKAKKSQVILHMDDVVDIVDDTKHNTGIFVRDKTTGEEQGKIASLSQEQLVRRAFATTRAEELATEFEQEQADTMPKRTQKGAKLCASSGWGSWTGKGAPLLPPRSKTQGLEESSPQNHSNPSGKRRASRKQDVIISRKRVKKTSDTFMLGEVPHPFSSREEYEQVMMGGIGREWNVGSAYRNMTRPDILTQSGKFIRPISKSLKVKRAAAKF